jgi:hypothetical protein
MSIDFNHQIDTKECERIVNYYTNLVYDEKDKEKVKNYISGLISNLLGEYNDYWDMAKFVETKSVKPYWDKASKVVFDGGNYGWSMIMKEMIHQIIGDDED